MAKAKRGERLFSLGYARCCCRCTHKITSVYSQAFRDALSEVKHPTPTQAGQWSALSLLCPCQLGSIELDLCWPRQRALSEHQNDKCENDGCWRSTVRISFLRTTRAALRRRGPAKSTRSRRIPFQRSFFLLRTRQLRVAAFKSLATDTCPPNAWSRPVLSSFPCAATAKRSPGALSDHRRRLVKLPDFAEETSPNGCCVSPFRGARNP